MSTHDYEIEWMGNGFTKTYWMSREYYYYNRHLSPAQPHFSRYCGRHRNKRLGASKGTHCKQFDPRPFKKFLKFHSRKTIPYRFEISSIHFRFGRKDGMHITNKFLY